MDESATKRYSEEVYGIFIKYFQIEKDVVMYINVFYCGLNNIKYGL